MQQRTFDWLRRYSLRVVVGALVVSTALGVTSSGYPSRIQATYINAGTPAAAATTILNVNGGAGGFPSIIVNSASAQPSWVNYQVNGANGVTVGNPGSAGSLITGSALGDFASACSTASCRFLFSTDSGSTSRLTLSQTGNTMAVPTSGATLTLNAVGGLSPGMLINAASAQPAAITFQVNSANPATVALAGNSGSYATGAILGDLVLRCDTANCRILGTNNAGTSSTDMTPSSGSFTATLVGCTTSPTATLNWQRIGAIVLLWASTAQSCTSNTTSFSVTGAPAGIIPTNTKRIPIDGITNNGTSGGGILSIGAGTVGFGTAQGTAGVFNNAFTASGTKGFSAGWIATYIVD